MSPAQQSTSPDWKTQQWASFVSDVRGEWLGEAPKPRALSAARGVLRVPFDGPPVGFESSIERDFLVLCRVEPRVRAVQAQQLRFRYFDRGRGRERRYTPDFVVDLAEDDGRVRRVVVEVKRHQDLWRSRRMMHAQYAAARVWAASQPLTTFRVVTDRAMAGWISNARLLSPLLDRPHDAELLEILRRAFGEFEERRLADIVSIARQLGFNSPAVLPAIYRMMAVGEFQYDRSQPITLRTWVRPLATTK